MENAPKPLDYAPRSSVRWFQKRWTRRALWTFAILALAPIAVVVAIQLWDWGITQVRIAKNRRLIRDAESYVAAPDQVVFEMDAGVVKTLKSAEPWVRWFPPDKFWPTVFLHKLSDPAGGRYNPEPLVVLQAETTLRDTYDGRTILDRPLLCFYGSEVSNVSSVGGYKSGVPGNLVILLQSGDHIVIYAGQPDPTNASRFSFRLDYNGVRQRVTGTLSSGVLTLQPDQGTVHAPSVWRHAAFWVPAGASPEQASISRHVAESSGVPGLTSWPVIPFGKAYNDVAIPPPQNGSSPQRTSPSP